MDPQMSKTIGGVGAILLFVGPLLAFAYSLGGLLSLIGFIMMLVALKGFADYYNEGGIFNNALYGFITGIAGVVAAIGAFVATALAVIADLGITDWTNSAEWIAALTAETALETIFALLAGAVVAFVILFIFGLLTAYFYRKSLGLLRSQSGVGLFGTAGMLLLIGAVLTIIFGIGLLLIWISFLIIAIAFFSMRITATAPETPPSPPPS